MKISDSTVLDKTYFDIMPHTYFRKAVSGVKLGICESI